MPHAGRIDSLPNLEHHLDRGRTEEAEEALRGLDDLAARIVVLSDTRW
jgi:hypothetical protein